uniref:Spermatogenesis associated 17 n=1 Tax=Eptatretus burgeri TaxID=7764 RepID=A0A8C4QQ80_EPTBU
MGHNMADVVRLRSRPCVSGQKYIERRRQEEQDRRKDILAAITIQTWLRGLRVRAYMRYLHDAATTIQRHWRGFFQRKSFHVLLRNALHTRNMEFYNCKAFNIQKIWRGYYVRKYVHNYYARKIYLETLMVANQITRIQLKEIVGSKACEWDRRFRESDEQRMDRLACRTHYLVSTRQIPGIYNSPFLKEPMDMERRLIEARPRINAERFLISARNSTRDWTEMSYQKPCSIPHIRAKKPQGPFLEQSQIWRHRLKPLEPTLRVATSFTSAEEAALEQKREEWRTRVIDDAFLPFANHRKNKKYEPLLQTSCAFGSIDYGTHHFRDTDTTKNISKKALAYTWKLEDGRRSK